MAFAIQDFDNFTFHCISDLVGGIGIQLAYAHFGATFLSLVYACSSLIFSLSSQVVPSSYTSAAFSLFHSVTGLTDISSFYDLNCPVSLKSLSQLVDKSAFDSLLSVPPSKRSRALLLSTSIPHACDWHDSLRDIIFSSAQSAALAPRKEVPGLIPGSCSRPTNIFLPSYTVLQPVVERLESEVPGLVLYSWDLDDGVFCGTSDDLLAALTIIEDLGPSSGLHLNLYKSLFYLPRLASNPHPLPSAIPFTSVGFVLL
uniref:Uncharacterized protein n=1 Tax=Amphimedon queenslandica TaxID=400682 RepID=A0A1X7UGV1_AMPQE